MSQSSSGNHRNRDGSRGNSQRRNSGNRRPQGGGSRNRNQGNRSGGGNRSRSRRPRQPQLTGFQKFLKAISFGLIDPAKKKKSSPRKPAAGKSTPSKKGGNRRKPEIVEPTTPRLYVGNLSYDVTDEELTEVFAGSGAVKEASVVRHGGSGRSKGFAFVEMGSLEEAKAAASQLNDKEIQGRSIFVTGAKAKKPRPEDGDRRDSKPRNRRDSEGRRDSSEGGSRSRRERKPRDRRGGRGEGEDKKPARQVRPLEVEKVETPVLLVANVNADATDVDIQDLFEDIGTVNGRESIGEGEDKVTSDLKVEFSELEGAQKAVELLHGKSFMGHQLKVTAFSGKAADNESATQAEAKVEEEPEEAAPAGEPAAAEIKVEENPVGESTPESTGSDDEEWSPSEEEK